MLLFCLTLGLGAPASAEDGYELWLRYRPIEKLKVSSIVVGSHGPRLKVAGQELQRGLSAMTGKPVGIRSEVADGAIVIGTPETSTLVAKLRPQLSGLGHEGFLLSSLTISGKRLTVVAANSEVGALYGAFALLRHLQTGHSLAGLNVRDGPRYTVRLLNHWDNLDGFVERGYAGKSLWDWKSLPKKLDPRYVDYARANASIGINGTVLTNVNANAEVLTAPYLRKVAALADTFRPWGIRVYLTARFSAPMEIGGLKTADPLDPAVRTWWKSKADGIYRSIPDFGGFLVKANSEGQPGPQDYKRSHADGANMLADALAPHGGTVVWRAFVYSAKPGDDRAKQASEEFKPLDGQFRPNVLLQVKNGPIDFQPREPFHPLFGQMPRTPVLMEAQITKEYLGFSTHLAYLGPLWEEVLDSDTCSQGCGTPVSTMLCGMAGVANIGSDRNWSGSQFDQANWYAFGRLAWDPLLSSRTIADEWTRMTWGNNPAVVEPVIGMMMGSRQAVVNYMTPLGLHHLMATSHHYGPGAWVDNLEREDWNPTYFHRADAGGIGFDRTPSGSNAVSQYAPGVGRCFERLDCVSEDLLLWFHHVGWDHRMRSGRMLWDELVTRYTLGVEQVRDMHRTWRSLDGKIDPERFAEVDANLIKQEQEAAWWRDASIVYFQSISKRPLPTGVAPPSHPLAYYKALRFDHVPGDPSGR